MVVSAPFVSSTISYSSLRTGDFDEEQEIEESRIRRIRESNHERAFDQLTESIDRISQISLNLAGEIELQGGIVGQLNDNTEGIEVIADNLHDQLIASERGAETVNICLAVFIGIMLILSLIILIHKKYIQ